MRTKSTEADAAQWLDTLQRERHTDDHAIRDAMQTVARLAWSGITPEGDWAEVTASALRLLVHQLFVPVAEQQSRSAGQINVHPDELLGCVPTTTIGGKTIIAAATRRSLALGDPVGVTSFAALAQLDPSRIRTLIRTGALSATNPERRSALPGRQPKGCEIRIEPTSAIKWLTN